jgi:glycosyltransferase involved in cell wall biosynthesis
MFQARGNGAVQRGTPIRSITAIVPAYNSAANLFPVVTGLLDVLLDVVPEFEVLIVDDASTDATPRLADELAAQHREVHVLHRARHEGRGTAWRQGIAAASTDYILLLHADTRIHLREIERLVQWNDQYDLVLGFRVRRGDRWQRRLGGLVYRLLLRALFSISVKDVNCDLKLCRTQLLQRLSLHCTGVAMHTELLVRARQLGATSREVGLAHTHRPGTRRWTRAGEAMHTGFELAALWRQLRRERQQALLAARGSVSSEATEKPPATDT